MLICLILYTYLRFTVLKHRGCQQRLVATIPGLLISGSKQQPERQKFSQLFQRENTFKWPTVCVFTKAFMHFQSLNDSTTNG